MSVDSFRDSKERALEQLGERPWFVGLGVTRVGTKRALLLTVRKGTAKTAQRALSRLRLGVPVVIREAERIRARQRSKSASTGITPRELAALRKEATRRS